MEKLNSNIGGGNTSDADSSDMVSWQDVKQAITDVKRQRETYGPGTDREAQSQKIVDSVTPDRKAILFQVDELEQELELVQKNEPFGNRQDSIKRQIEALKKDLNLK